MKFKINQVKDWTLAIVIDDRIKQIELEDNMFKR